jgi:hypothetical protein
VLLHHLGPVVDGQDDISDTGGGKGLDLVEDHGLVRKLDQGLGKGEGLGGGELVSCLRFDIE